MLITSHLLEAKSTPDLNKRILVGTNDDQRSNQTIKTKKQSSLPVDNITQVSTKPTQDPYQQQQLLGPYQKRASGSASNNLVHRYVTPNSMG